MLQRVSVRYGTAIDSEGYRDRASRKEVGYSDCRCLPRNALGAYRLGLPRRVEDRRIRKCLAHIHGRCVDER
jgi:hypothetical protein